MIPQTCLVPLTTTLLPSPGIGLGEETWAEGDNVSFGSRTQCSAHIHTIKDVIICIWTSGILC
jgi:hypothetical protein